MEGRLWEAQPEQMALFRRAVDRKPHVLSDLIEAPEFLRAFGGLRGERLKSAPRGYAKDDPAIEILKLKQVYVARQFPDKVVVAHDFIDRLVDTFHGMKSFLTT